MKNEDIKKAFECLTPSEEAKDRMFEAILEKSSEESLKTPWFIRFRPVISTAGALAACGVLFTFAALNPHITGGKNDFVETKPAMESPAVTVISDENVTTSAVTSVTAKSSETSAKTTNSDKMTTWDEVKTSAQAAEITTAAYTETTAVQTAAETTAPATAASTVCDEEVSASETETVTTAATSAADLYGDLYDFSLVSWAGRDYTTSYEEVPYSSLVSNLGSGAAFSDTSEGAYTILIYEIEGVPVEKGFAVHYMGQNSYYYFYSAR
ncbi:MAG: hypothetical protein ACI4JN_08450 [Ruminococcus sp.]